MAKLRFSITSNEILRFKYSALEKTNDLQTNIDILHETQFIQWSGDYVDHNLVTLTGKDTFHGMGIIQMAGTQPPSEIIRRLKYRQRSADFGKKQSIPIHYYLGSSSKGLAKLHLQAIRTLQTPITLPAEVGYDFLLYSSIFAARLTPNWSGFMQDLTGKSVPKQKNYITFLPNIDMNPNYGHCMYSILIFIIEQARPLWLKATGIIAESKLNTIARLGGFHTAISFLGAIGKLMKGFVLEQLFSEVYAENSVIHMMSGKAVSRSLCGHLLVESSPISILLEELAECQLIDLQPLKSFLEVLDEKFIDEINLFCHSAEVFLVEQVWQKKKKRIRTAIKNCKAIATLHPLCQSTEKLHNS